MGWDGPVRASARFKHHANSRRCRGEWRPAGGRRDVPWQYPMGAVAPNRLTGEERYVSEIVDPAAPLPSDALAA
ncbi:hypothetical protein GCM10010345_77240 [Streptomyces canarius]|uniref:Uncharacterized protein n=1 Tax=Streptomyces canarius TaxID=285453 RepID=A0ABQ3DC50_9ACTN|nr:hypothetical protein GCM10010345_77240 [Streptomyces canarius]